MYIFKVMIKLKNGDTIPIEYVYDLYVKLDYNMNKLISEIGRTRSFVASILSLSIQRKRLRKDEFDDCIPEKLPYIYDYEGTVGSCKF